MITNKLFASAMLLPALTFSQAGTALADCNHPPRARVISGEVTATNYTENTFTLDTRRDDDLTVSYTDSSRIKVRGEDAGTDELDIALGEKVRVVGKVVDSDDDDENATIQAKLILIGKVSAE